MDRSAAGAAVTRRGFVGATAVAFAFGAAGACGGSPASPGSQPASGDGGVLGGLGGLLDKLQKGGLADIANSWIGSGPNQPVPSSQLGSALGPEIIKTLAQRSGLPEEEITKQLAQVLPGVVDKLTPAGRLPTAAELSQ